MTLATAAARDTDQDAIRRALDAAVDWLRDQQSPDGWWKGELETNVTMDAEDVLLRHALGILTPELAGATATWIRSQQRADGTWATFYGGPADLSTTVEAYVALRLAGDAADAEHLSAARAFVLDSGGVERTRVFTRFWLAMVGQWPWTALPALPPEIVLLPRAVPLNIYDFACWARQTIVALAVVSAYRPTWPLPFGIDELRTGTMTDATRASPFTTAGRFALLDRMLHAYERMPPSAFPKWPTRALALRAAEQWIVRRQEADGSWGGIQPPWVYSLLALHLRGYALDHPVMRAGLAGLERFTITEHGTRRLEACQSPVWDTALAVVALSDAAVAADDPALVRAGRWLVDHEVRVRGDWAVKRPRLAPGGWAFEFANDHYPDVDDTAEVVLALRRVASAPVPGADDAIARGVAWVLGMRSRDGAWGAFDVDNDRELCRQLPFCDFGEVIDPPSADVTAHALEMLANERVHGSVLRAAIAWLRAAQEPSGSWFGRWGANHVYGVGAVVPALVAAGVAIDDAAITRAVAWLEEHQNADGGWGEDLRSYRDAAWVGRGTSTASQTAWALLALLAARCHDREIVRRGVAWLVATQRRDGTWDEPQFTGTGFPGDFSINYHLYRHVFPIMALGRFLGGTNPTLPGSAAAESGQP
jgi:squalene-hopene/tetraprenyl-beta-curcumene cyclase